MIPPHEPDAKVLAKIMLLQSMIGQLAPDKTLIEFVCRGLEDLPGVKEVFFASSQEDAVFDSSVFHLVPLAIGDKTYGTIVIHVAEQDLFDSYPAYVHNLALMIAAVFEQEHQKMQKENYRRELERQVEERTRQLRVQVQETRATEAVAQHQRRRAERYLEVSEAVIIELDPEGRIVVLNQRGCEILGYETGELVGKNWFTVVVPPENREEIRDVFESIVDSSRDSVTHCDNLVMTKTGEKRLFSWHNVPRYDDRGNIDGTMSSGIDITEKRKLMEAMQRADKLESLGVLAGGIAHDFNNLLGGIFGFLSLAREMAPEESDISECILSALSAFDRARALTQQLLTFSKGGEPNLKTQSIDAVIRDTVAFALSGSRVGYAIDIDEELYTCRIDKNQIGQVIDNLVINAIQAMPEGGTVRVSARNVCLNSDNKWELPGGRYVAFTIADSGKGIPPEMLGRVFDPFFTMKETGTGLGLATCYSIVTKHGGAIDVESKLNIGTHFTVYLPVSDAAADSTSSPSSPGEVNQSGGAVLVMDDEEVNRDLYSRMLTALGYAPSSVGDGDEMLQLCRDLSEKKVTPFAILLDLTVPGGLGGRDIIDELRSLYPDTPIFAISGYSDDPVIAEPERFGFTASIKKPFLKETLGRVLQGMG